MDRSSGFRGLRRVLKNYELYLFLLPAVVLIFCFHYLPIYGVQIAFKNYTFSKGIWGSPWVGLTQFTRFFRAYQSRIVISNTLILSLYGMVVGFPLPIVLALMMNSMRTPRFKRALQTVTYMPYFISTVILVGMVNLYLSPTGLYGQFVRLFGGTPEILLNNPEAFRHVYVWSGIWQGTGWSSIIYMAALSSVDPALYEAATIDGANKPQKIFHIDLPTIAPTCIILLILSAGGILNVGFEKAFLLQNSLNLNRSEVINTYVYKVGIENAQYSFSAAVGLFNNVINFIILSLVNFIAGKLGETRLF
jgi:putative aldouronate transport system permease protein